MAEDKGSSKQTGQVTEPKEKKWYQKPKYLIGIAIVTGTVGIVLNSVASNLQGVVNLMPMTDQELEKYVSPEDQRRVENAEREIREQEERESALQLQKEIVIEQARIKAEQEMAEPLKEGYTWAYNALDDTYIQVPADSLGTQDGADKEVPEQDESYVEEQANQFFSDENIEITKPRDEVIIELAKNLSDIDPNNIYLTKGQFIFWLQDNLLYTVGDNAIQTFWDPETRTATVRTNFGDAEEVKALTEGRIQIAYDNSSFNLTDPGALTIVFE